MKRPVTNRNEGQKRLRGSNEEHSVLGIIESVSLQNFMCHENLKFDFHPHMNFIIGQNGSGKSAILTAIILALGGKSSATGRYKNLKGFVKNNKHTSTIRVTLKNCGPNAYKPEVYGERVLVERVINSTGAGQYKIKSENGNIVATVKEELRNILECHGIQIENPTTILTQEASRKFLISTDSKTLFQFFYKGTNLKKVEDEYYSSIKHKNDTQQEILVKKMLLPEMEKEVKRLKAYLDSSEKIPDYKNELLWAAVIEMEEKMESKKLEHERAEQKLSSCKEQLNKYKNENMKMNHSLDKFNKNIEECKLLIAKHREEVKTMNVEREKIKSSMREYQGTIERQSREIRRRNDEISALENQINNIREKNENSVNEKKRKQEVLIETLKKEISSKQQHLEYLKETHRKHNEDTITLQQQLDNFNESLHSLKHVRTEAEKEYMELKKGKNDRLNVFGIETTNICLDIKNSFKHFQKQPKGPIGAYIEVKDPKWNFAVQCCLGEYFLKSFCCDNFEDAATLRGIFAKHCHSGRMPSTLTSSFLPKVHDVQAFKAESKYPTLLDLLEIKDPVIANCLIDQRKIESIIMIENPADACEYMMKNSPKNCVVAYAINGDQIYANPYRSYPNRQNRYRMYLLKTIDDSDISNKKKFLDQVDKDLKNKENLLREAKTAYTRNLEQLRSVQDYMNKTNTELKVKEKLLEKGTEELNYSEQTDINGMLGDLNELQKERDTADNELAEIQGHLHSKAAELSAININEKRDQLDKESAKYSNLTMKLMECETKKANLGVKINKFESEVSNLTAVANLLLKEYEECANFAKQAETSAKEICSRIETDRSSETIRQLLEEMEKTLQKETNCSPESLREQYEEKYRKWVQFKKELENLEFIVLRIHRMLEMRKKQFDAICKNTALCLSLIFTTTLQKNKFVGDIEVLFDERELKINARPEKHANRDSKSYHQLSGGERSFITIAFLLALWDRVEMPFRILDEYDVFMDSDNRHLSIGLLIDKAKSKKNIQYVFLSPLDLPPMEDSANIKVHKMPAPKRKRTHSELGTG